MSELDQLLESWKDFGHLHSRKKLEQVMAMLKRCREQRNEAMTLNWTKTTDEKIQAVIEQDDAELLAISRGEK